MVVPWFIQRLLAITWWFLLGITLIRPSLTGLLSDPGGPLRHYFWPHLLGRTRLWKTCKLTTHLQDLPFFLTMLRRAIFLSLVVVLGCDFSAAISRARGHHHHKTKTKVQQSTLALSSTPRRHRRWRRIFFWNPVFKPSHDSLLKQNAEIDRLELPRIQDDAELEQLKLDGKLVPIVPSEALRVDPRLDPDRRYCRPWTLKFVQDLADAYHQQFGDQIQVNSAVRTVVVQKKLRRHNRNAAPAEGEIASSHLAGLTVDLQRRGMSKAEVKWVENYLIPMKAAGLVEPEEERRQWVFHIMVSSRYDEPDDRTGDKTEVAQSGTDELEDEDRPPTLQRAKQSLADAPDFLLPDLAPSAMPLMMVPSAVAPKPAEPGSVPGSIPAAAPVPASSNSGGQ